MTEFQKGDRVRVLSPVFLEAQKSPGSRVLATVSRVGTPVIYTGDHERRDGVQVQFDHPPYRGSFGYMTVGNFAPEHLELVTRQMGPTWGGMRWHEGQFIPKVRKVKYSSTWEVVYATSPQCMVVDYLHTWDAAVYYATHQELW